MSSCGGYQCQEVEEYCDVIHVCTACRDICPYPYDIEEHRPQIADCEKFCPKYHKKVYGENALTTSGVTVALAVTTAPTPAGLSTTLTASAAVVASLALISLIVLVYCSRRFRKKGHHSTYHKSKASSDTERSDSAGVTAAHEMVPLQNEEYLSLGGNPVMQVSGGEQHSSITLPSVAFENNPPVTLNLHGPDSPEVNFAEATAAAIFTSAQRSKPPENSPRPVRPAAVPPTDVSRHRALLGTVDNGNSPTSTPSPLVRSNTAEGSLCLRSTSPGEETDDVTGQAQATLPVEESVVSLENNTERWQMVMKMYDGIDANMHRLPFVRGCLVGSDALQVYVLGDDVDSYYNQIRNVLPSDPLVQELLIVQPE